MHIPVDKVRGVAHHRRKSAAGADARMKEARARIERERKLRAEPDPAEDARAGRGRAGGVVVAAVRGLAIVVVGAVLIAAGAVGGTYVSWNLLPHLFGTREEVYGLPVGTLAGIVAAFWFAHMGRRWVLRARLRRLRSGGVRTTATIQNIRTEFQVGSRGGGNTTYHLTLCWTDPFSGVRYVLRRRRYRFFGTAGSATFEKACAAREIPVLYPPHRPWRLVADIPFAPIMADLLT